MYKSKFNLLKLLKIYSFEIANVPIINSDGKTILIPLIILEFFVFIFLVKS